MEGHTIDRQDHIPTKSVCSLNRTMCAPNLSFDEAIAYDSAYFGVFFGRYFMAGQSAMSGMYRRTGADFFGSSSLLVNDGHFSALVACVNTVCK